MRGAGLILLLFLFVAIFHYSRWTFPEREELPAFLFLKPELATVVIVDSEGDERLYQLNDGNQLADVIKMTELIPGDGRLQEDLDAKAILSGEIIKVLRKEEEYFQVERTWLSARHRILLQIPLHPDRMTALDWEVLPGLGPKLATTIEIDRHKNGDFHDFLALERVKGVGPKKLESWQPYFRDKNDRYENK